MADQRYTDHTLDNSPIGTSEIPYWDTVANAPRKAHISAIVGAYLTGGDPTLAINDLETYMANVRAGVVNVMDAPYNATGDGTTDDSTAVAAAITAAGAGDTVLFPPGYTYKINSTQTLATAGVVLYGPGATIDASAMAAGNLFNVTGNNVEIAGFTFTGPNTVGSAVADVGNNERAIYLAGSNGRVHDCTFTGFWEGGVVIAGNHNRVHDNTLTNVRHQTTSTGHWGSIHMTGDYNLVENNHVLDFYDSGITAFAANFCVVRGNLLQTSLDAGASSSMGMRFVDACAGCVIANNVIRNTVFEGIAIATGAASKISAYHTVTGNVIEDAQYVGIRLYCNGGGVGTESYLRHITVANNVIMATALTGVQVMESAIQAISTDANNKPEHIVISGNTIRGAATILTFGIRLNGAGVRRCVVSGNSVVGAGQEGISASGAEQLVIGNMVADCVTGIRVIFGNGCIVTENRVINSTTQALTLSQSMGQSRITNNHIDKKPLQDSMTGNPLIKSNTVSGVAFAGTVTLNGTTGVVATPGGLSATYSDGAIGLYRQTNGTGTPGQLYISDINQAGPSFRIKSTEATDNGIVYYEIIR